jgi:hypothetical protein
MDPNVRLHEDEEKYLEDVTLGSGAIYHGATRNNLSCHYPVLKRSIGQ